MSFRVFNIDMTLQIRSKILFEKCFGDALMCSIAPNAAVWCPKRKHGAVLLML